MASWLSAGVVSAAVGADADVATAAAAAVADAVCGAAVLGAVAPRRSIALSNSLPSCARCVLCQGRGLVLGLVCDLPPACHWHSAVAVLIIFAAAVFRVIHDGRMVDH